MSAGNHCRKNAADPRYEGAFDRSDHISPILPSLASHTRRQLLHTQLEQIIHSGGNVLHRVGDYVDVVGAFPGWKCHILSVSKNCTPCRIVSSSFRGPISPTVKFPHCPSRTVTLL